MERYPKYDFEVKKEGLFSFLRHSTDRIDTILDPWTSNVNTFDSTPVIYQKLSLFGERPIEQCLYPFKLFDKESEELAVSLKQLNTQIKVLIKYARSTKDYEALSGIDDIQDQVTLLVDGYNFEKYGFSLIRSEVYAIAIVTQAFLVTLKEQFYNYAIDLREGFRRIIQFMFKNLDDESDSNKNSTLKPTNKVRISYCNFLNIYYEPKGHSYRRQDYQLAF